MKPGSMHGASLLETVLALAIASVFVATALPTMNAAVVSQRVSAATTTLFTAFNLARAEAIARSQRVALAPVDGVNWSAGWYVFVDGDDDGLLAADETVLRRFAGPGDGILIKPYFGATNPGRVLSFAPNGRLQRPGSVGLVIGRLIVQHGAAARALCFSSGSMRIAHATTCT